jgi:Dyp-type peroxidase family
MVSSAPTRETPASLQFFHGIDDPAFPNVGDSTKPEFEEVLQVDIIQGNVIDGGFNKDFQTVLCLQITDINRFRVWLKSQINFISTAEQVIAFNRLFKAIRKLRGEPTGLKATWVNISFSFSALQQLAGSSESDKFIDTSFKQGLAARSTDLGDPTNPNAAGNPKNWLVGGGNNEAHVLLLVASDDRNDMRNEVSRIEKSINDTYNPSGAKVIFREEGANLPAPLGGHEHFGTLDGISQPGVRGRISDEPHDVLTPRQNPEKVDDKGNRTQGKPGQDLLWPGEFVFGYPEQNKDADTLNDSKGNIRKAVNIPSSEPHWTDNGSLLVFRRLRQDVFKFHSFQQKTAQDLQTKPLLVSAKLVGRWESGAPTVRTPDQDNPAMGNDDCANNDFGFNNDPGTPDSKSSGFDCQDNFKDAPKDDATDGGTAATGKRCPFTAHTRKTYPRNDLTPDGNTPEKGEVTTQTHRMLRRGIPYGIGSTSTPNTPVMDNVDRGLHFLAYQTSITNQFEFVTRNWVNNPNFSTEATTGHECQKAGQSELPLGHDPVIGQSNGPNGDRSRSFFIQLKDDSGKERCEKLLAPEDWVIPTGGGYFFTPSIDALKNELT